MDAHTHKLQTPVQWGKGELVEELVLKPTPRAFRGVSLTVDAAGKIDYQPYTLAQVGVLMAGKPAPFVDKLDVADMNAIAQVVLGFFGSGPETGSES